MPIRLHLADDHTMFRQGLEAILASREGIEVVGSTSIDPEAEERIRRTKPDVVVTQLDTELKEAQGILAGIREASPDSRIVVLTLFDNLRYVRAISKMGIDAYLHKASSADELIATLDLLGRNPGGQNVVVTLPPGLLQRFDEEPVGGLSERETELLVLAARGLSKRRIAEQMHIAEATVKRTWPTSTRRWASAPGPRR